MNAVICAEQQRLLNAERALRSDAKSKLDIRVAADLANAALLLQRERHNHERSCRACLHIAAARRQAA